MARRLLAVVLAVVALAFTGQTAFGASPSVTTVMPRGGQRGHEVDIVLRGERLADAVGIVFERPGITTGDLVVENASTIRATLTIAADCPLGLHAMRVHTASGISNLRTFSVGVLAEVMEHEPNNTFADAQAITLDTTVNGVADNEDVDYYAVEAVEGERLSVEIEGLRLGDVLFDPFVAVFNDAGFEQASCDDAPLLHQDAAVSMVVPKSGRYVIQVRESAYRGNGRCCYRLHVGRFARPGGTLPCGGRPGEPLAVRWLGDPAGEPESTVTLPADAASGRGLTDGWIDGGVVGIRAADAAGMSPSPNWLRLASIDNQIEDEPNDRPADANPVETPRALNGVIGTPGDRDWYAFTAAKGQVYDIAVFARRLGSPLDAVINVRDEAGKYLAGNDDGAGPDAVLRFTAPADGLHRILVRDHLGRGGETFFYRVEIAPVTPSLRLQAPREVQAVAVPRGNRSAIVLSAERLDFGGPITLAGDGLPEGVSMSVVEAAASVSAIPVVFTADPAAPIACGLPRISAESSGAGVRGGYRQDVELVLGRNRVVFWAHTTDRLPVAVTEPAPFAIDVAVPAAPLVRGGSMQLQVTATRAEGFTAPIRLSVPFVPPGVGAGNSVVIPEGQDSARIPVNANGGAALGAWHLVVVAEAPAPSGGPITVSSALTPVTIAEPFVAFTGQATSVEQGRETTLYVKVDRRLGDAGAAQVTLRGLPHHVSAEPVELAPDATDLTFSIKTQADSPPGRHTNVFCVATFTRDGEPVVHRLPAAELRIDRPLPPALATAPPPPPAPEPEKAAAPVEAPPRPLTRLEKLRQQHEERKRLRAIEDTGSEAGAPLAGIGAPLAPWQRAAVHACLGLTETPDIAALAVYPPEVRLEHAGDVQTLAVIATTADGLTLDLTGAAEIAARDPGIVSIEDQRLHAAADGSTEITVTCAGHTRAVPVTVTNAAQRRPVSFRLDVLPVLTVAGCNSGACHGSARGQDGFHLSLFAYDPGGDYHRLTRELPGRRVDTAFPGTSLMLEKPTAMVPHTGGKRFEIGSEDYETIRRWIAAGVPPDPPDVTAAIGIEIYPPEGVIGGSGQTIALNVRARYADGTDRDVTSLAVFRTSNARSAAISRGGLLTSGRPGEAFITASFGTHAVGSPFIVLPGSETFVFEDPEGPAPEDSIDALVNAKLAKLRMNPSALCTDETFLRRAHLDLVGLLPTPAERAAFLADERFDKRLALIDRLLERKEFVELWVMQWAELLQIRSNDRISEKAALLFFEWVRNEIMSGVKADALVKEILTARGGTFAAPPTNFYQNQPDTLVLAENVAQAFLGIRVQCAQCHNHPFDRWTQDDYYGFAAFFAQVGRKRGADPRETIVFNRGNGEVKHPVGGAAVAPKFLGDVVPVVKGKDRRAVVADWMTAPENPYFARSIANRLWAHFTGVGIIEPVDDFRVSNPPSNGPLLGALADRLVAYEYDVKRLVRDIVASRAYQRSTSRTETNRADERNFAHALVRRIRSETLIDVVCQVTEQPEKFQGLPLGARAVEIADGTTSTYFLTTFGRAPRDTVSACEVSREPSLSQALHLLNGGTIDRKIREGPLVGRLIASGATPAAIAHDLYVRALCREPTTHETEAAAAALAGAEDPLPVLEDVYWAILNSREFVFNH